jgi:putative transposase
MARKKKHTRVEIAAKLAQANELAAGGVLQSEIAHTLGVSVMTLYRWRKTPTEPAAASAASNELNRFEIELGQGQRIADIQLENARLRRLVTDLLLEKMKLEESAQSCALPSDQRRLSR